MNDHWPMVTIDDLRHIYIRAQMADGRHGTVNCAEASDRQFDAWARARLAGIGAEMPWPLEQRAIFCNFLGRIGRLSTLNEEDEEEGADCE